MTSTRTFAAGLEGAAPFSKLESGVSTIGDMARTYGVSLRTLRFYEDRGLLQPFRNGTTRLYDERARQRLQMILKGKQLGFTLAEIRDMLRAQADDSVREFELALEPEQVLSQISLLQRQRAALDRSIEALKKTHERLAGTAASAGGAGRGAKAG